MIPLVFVVFPSRHPSSEQRCNSKCIARTLRATFVAWRRFFFRSRVRHVRNCHACCPAAQAEARSGDSHTFVTGLPATLSVPSGVVMTAVMTLSEISRPPVQPRPREMTHSPPYTSSALQTDGRSILSPGCEVRGVRYQIRYGRVSVEKRGSKQGESFTHRYSSRSCSTTDRIPHS